jgi:calcineurin-like phosphoesterase family protein
MVNFYTSDEHFGHVRIIELCDRPFATVDEQNEYLIHAYNNVVGVDDTTYFLGDIALGVIKDSLPLVSRLNGYKYLVPGNHDRIFSDEKPANIARWMPEYHKVFDGILQEEVHGWFIGRHEIVMSHFPYEGDSRHDERYAHKRPNDEGVSLVCGHVHNVWAEKFTSKGTLQVNVGVDVREFAPISEDELEAIMDAVA